MLDIILKNFDRPDEVRIFDKGKFEIIRIGGLAIGRGTYEPGMALVDGCRPGGAGSSRCNVEHVCLVLSGCSAAAIDGRPQRMCPAGTFFYIPSGPPGHDSWVVGDEPYVSLHFLGTEQVREEMKAHFVRRE